TPEHQLEDNAGGDNSATPEKQPEDGAVVDNSATPEKQAEDSAGGDDAETPEHQPEDSAGGDDAETPEQQPEDGAGSDEAEIPEHQPEDNAGVDNAETPEHQPEDAAGADNSETPEHQTEDAAGADNSETPEHQPEDSAGSDEAKTPEQQPEDGTGADNAETPEHQPEDSAGGDNAKTPEHQPEDSAGADNAETTEQQPEDSAGSDEAEIPKHQPKEDGAGGDNTETPEHQPEDSETPEQQTKDGDGADNKDRKIDQSADKNNINGKTLWNNGDAPGIDESRKLNLNNLHDEFVDPSAPGLYSDDAEDSDDQNDEDKSVPDSDMNEDKLYFGNAGVTSTVDRKNIDGNPELGLESKENKMILQSLELKLQSKMKDDGVLVDEAYGNAVDLRARLRDLVLQIKHKELEENISILATDEAKELKQRLFELEQYLEVWKKKEALFLTSVASEAEIVDRIQKLEHNLVQRESEDKDLSQARQEAEDLKWRLGKLEDVLENKSILPSSHFNRLKESLESEIEERKEMDKRALLATERETLLMKTKLTTLEQQLHGHGEGNKEFIDMMRSEADVLKKRLGQLESNVVTRKSNKELLQISENKQEALLGRISLLEVELERRKKDEVALQSAQQEAAELKEKFGHLDVRMKEIMEKQNPLLQEKFLHLENEVKHRKETESASILKVQKEAANVMNKILDLEKLLHENKQENNSKQHMNEVFLLKDQIKRLEEELNKRTRLDTNRNERSTKREEELQMRVNSLKNELQAMVKHEETAEKHFKQSQEIINRVIALEKQLNIKFNDDSKLNNVGAKQEKNALRKTSDGITVNDFWDLIPTTQKCDAVLEDSSTDNLKEELFKQKDDAFVNETIAETNTDEKCTFEIEERIRCDIARSSLHCKALKCCWDPHPNPEIPDCFFSRVQLSRKSQQMKKLEDSYEKLHEGKEVDWDESVKEREADKTKKSTWDETLGVADIKTEIILKSKTEAIENTNGETNSTMLGDKDDKQENKGMEDKRTENDKSDTTADGVKDEFQWQSAQASIKFVQRENVGQQQVKTETNDPLIDNGSRKKESSKQTNEIVPKKESHQENFKSSQDEQTNNDSTGKDGMSDYSDILKTEEVNKDGEPYVESVAVKIMLLVFELPFDVVYVLTPLALWVMM
ncbi:hypothetical protein IE077_001087, partial [Cardiosporidium cionae]